MTPKQEAAWLKKRTATARRCGCQHCREFLQALKVIRRQMALDRALKEM